MIDFTKKSTLYINYIIMLALCFFPFFLHLASRPLQGWDEARQAVSAFEMIQNKNFFVNYYDGSPDMWSTKPPFFIWMVALSMKAFGYGLLAIRLPSALFGLATAFLLLFFGKNYIGDIRAGIIALLILITSTGFVDFHVVRTADYDAPLVFFMLLYILSFFKYLNAENQKASKKYLWMFSGSLICAIWSKGVAGLIMLPALIIYVLIEGKLKKLLKDKCIYFHMLLVLICGGVLYVIRELKNPGYLAAVVNNEILGRYFQTSEGHKEPFLFYWNNLVNVRFNPWIFLVPFSCILLPFVIEDSRLRKITVYFSICCVTFFIFISIGNTKLIWYDAPLYTLMSLLVAVTIFSFYKRVIQASPMGQRLEWLFFPLMLLMLFFIPYEHVLAKHWDKQEINYTDSGYMIKVAEKIPSIQNFTFVTEDINQVFLYYGHVLGLEGKKPVMAGQNSINFINGDTVVACRQFIKEKIESKFNYKLISENDGCKIYVIESSKERSVANLIRIEAEHLKKSEMADMIIQKAKTYNVAQETQFLRDAMYILESKGEITTDEKEQFKRESGIR